MGEPHSCLCVLIGIPAVGKSSLSQALSDSFRRTNPTQPCLIVCIDSIYDELTHQQGADASFSPETWQESRQIAFDRASSFLHECSTSGRPGLLIVDDNMHYRSMRFEYFRVAQKESAAYVQLYIDCNVEVARTRNRLRTGFSRVPDASFDRIVEQIEVPATDRCFFDRFTVRIDSTNTSWSGEVVCGVLDQIGQVWQQGPAPPLPDAELMQVKKDLARITNATSLVHQLDLQTRKALTKAMADFTARPGADKAVLARRMNDLRREALDEARRRVAGSAGADMDRVYDSVIGGFERIVTEEMLAHLLV